MQISVLVSHRLLPVQYQRDNVVPLGVRQYCASGHERDAGRLYEEGNKKRMKKKKTELKCNFLLTKTRNNARPPDTKKLRLKAILSVLDSMFVRF